MMASTFAMISPIWFLILSFIFVYEEMISCFYLFSGEPGYSYVVLRYYPNYNISLSISIRSSLSLSQFGSLFNDSIKNIKFKNKINLHSRTFFMFCWIISFGGFKSSGATVWLLYCLLFDVAVVEGGGICYTCASSGLLYIVAGGC